MTTEEWYQQIRVLRQLGREEQKSTPSNYNAELIVKRVNITSSFRGHTVV
ncbi:hypothetical protein J056_003816 [Wallemia ichthyophaga EXF-994]|uniref:Uncharacterized protein n=1 Tax=Wallemia ichthyophaga (strain EXF-994 / CBS 113033) TaxID=1299270 RepID=R9A945_WALI9|nr:uncharacterized protein J056_003816 [Wallemia ichthyophaga EXF-994]EOQ98642.1 hypothetical protein J056_003816 [Wallemia ichthyophaga EXF-994]